MRKVELEKKLDAIIDFAGDFDFLDSYFDTKVREDIDPAALKYFSGYVVRKAKKSTVAKSCEKCFQCLLAPANQADSDNDLIEFRSHGYLFTPSDILMNIVYRLETAILTVLDKDTISENILFEGNISASFCTYYKRNCVHSYLTSYLLSSFFPQLSVR